MFVLLIWGVVPNSLLCIVTSALESSAVGCDANSWNSHTDIPGERLDASPWVGLLNCRRDFKRDFDLVFQNVDCSFFFFFLAIILGFLTSTVFE